MSPRYLLASDLQLGVGDSLGRVPGERLAEQEAVWLTIVETANRLNVPLLFLGDAWERRRPTPAELLAYFRPLARAKRETLSIQGNHDVEAFEKPTGYDLRGNLHQARPDIVCVDGTVFCCLPWAPPGRLVALEGGGDRDDLNDRLAVGLVEIARGLYAQAAALMEPGKPLPVVLIGHWHVDAATSRTGAGAPRGLFREPLLNYAALEAIGFDAIALGHHHTPAMLGDRGFHVGSPMPCNFGEATYQHVVWLLDVEPGKFTAEQIPVASRRLVDVRLTAEQAIQACDAEWPPAVDVRDAVVKIRVAATADEARRVDTALLGREALAAGAHKIWQSVVEVERADALPGVTLAEDMTDVDALAEWLAVNVEGEADVAELFDVGTGYIEAAAA